MEKLIQDLIKNFGNFFRELPPIKRFSVVTTFVAVIGIVAALIVWASQTQFKVLYTNLTPEDLATVSQILEQAKIPYQTDEDGKTIKIPEEKVEFFRMEIAKKGVSFSSALGYEILDKQSLGTTNFVQKINRQRATEGELVKSIMHLKGVKRARVHLSIPENSPFVLEKRPPSASIILDIDPLYTMTQEEIRGIGSLVASAIDGLRSEQVVIIDSRGKKLSENISDQMTAETASRMALEERLNRQYEQQIEDILSKAVGQNKVVAKVNITLDYTQKQETQVSYDPENVAVVAEVTDSQTFQGSRPLPQGAPGPNTNLPGNANNQQPPATTSDTNKNLINRNYSVSSKTTQSKKPVAEIKNLSVAVMIDGKKSISDQKNAAGDNPAKAKYIPWTAEELKNFQELIVSSLGLKIDRGDQVVIKNMEFIEEDLSGMDALLKAQEQREFMKNAAKYFTIGLLITLFFFMVVKPFIQWVTDNTIESIDDFLPKTLQELESLQQNQKLPGLEDALPMIDDGMNPEKIEGNMLREKVLGLVEGNPMKAAQVVTAMLHAVDDRKIA